ncbi:MAG TPA: hypothetical protein VGH80_13135 [Xanthomonadaceae bacterium]
MSLNEKPEKLGRENAPDEACASPPPAKARACFVLGYKYDPALAAEPIGTVLATHRAAVVHAEKTAAALVKRYPQIHVEVGNPVFLRERDLAFNFTVSMEAKEPELLAASTRLEELLRSELRSIEIATSMLRAGHIALARVIENGLADLPRIKAAPANQSEIVRIDMDGSLYITVAKGLDDVRAHRSLLKAAETANSCGMRISAKFKKENYDYPVLPPGATKPDWIATACTVEVAKVTGFLETSRVVEIRVGKVVHTLAVKHDESAAYAAAFRNSRFVRIRLKTSRPGNPFQTDDPKYNIDETLEFMDHDGQQKIDLQGD